MLHPISSLATAWFPEASVDNVVESDNILCKTPPRSAWWVSWTLGKYRGGQFVGTAAHHRFEFVTAVFTR
jgi:hypothetical protein